MNVWRYSKAGALIIAGLLKTGLVNCKLKLAQGVIVPGVDTTAASLTEANFSGYVAKVVAAVNNPYLPPAGGANLIIPTQQWDFDPTVMPPVTNDIGGWWLEHATLGFMGCGAFPSLVPMNIGGDSLPLTVFLNWGQENVTFDLGPTP